MSPPRLILASRSPRRALLLREAGYTFEQMDPPFDDPPHPESDHPDARAVAMALAAAKAMSLAHSPALAGAGDVVILAADTLIVHHDGALAGTPQTPAEARDMLRRFVNRRHQVVSGIAVWRHGLSAPITAADAAAVDFGDVSADDLEAYLRSDHWRGKAGGYNLFERQAAGWPITVQGLESTVVGLPMPMVQRLLGAWGMAGCSSPGERARS